MSGLKVYRIALMAAGLVTVHSSRGLAGTFETMNGAPVQMQSYVDEPGAPTVTVPLGTPQVFLDSADPTGPPGASSPDFVGTSYDQYLGQVVGSGQCVALVQAGGSNAGLTATWRSGDSVQGNTSLQPGTVIATFGSNGNYTNSTDGSSHAAVYVGQNAQGIQVEDQWAGQPAHLRTIYWNDPNSSSAANNGTNFHVVTHAA